MIKGSSVQGLKFIILRRQPQADLAGRTTAFPELQEEKLQTDLYTHCKVKLSLLQLFYQSRWKTMRYEPATVCAIFGKKNPEIGKQVDIRYQKSYK